MKRLTAYREAQGHKTPTHELFPYQYAISRAPMEPDVGFDTLELPPLHIVSSARLPRARLTNAAGQTVGWVLGLAVDAEGALVEGDRMLPEGAPFWSAVEEFVIGLAGRGVVIAASEGEARLYPDPSSNLPCLYDPETGRVGASLLMCLEREIDPDPDFDHEAVLSGSARFCFGRTADRFVRRLAANHYLDLIRMRETRFWPSGGEFAAVEEARFDETLDAIIDRLGAVFGALVRGRRCLVPVTGGNDSRVLVAAGRMHLDHVEQFFTHIHHRVSRVDSQSARMMIEALGQEHTRYHQSDITPPNRHALRRRRARFHSTTGYMAAPIGELLSGLKSAPPHDLPILRGNVQEILRAAHWVERDRTANPHYASVMRRSFYATGDAMTPEFLEQWRGEYDAWLGPLPEDAREVAYDMIFIEHNLPHFGIGTLGFTNNFYLSPFNDRRLIALAGGLPPPFRTSNEPNVRLVRKAAPEIEGTPFARDIMRSRARRRARA